MVLAASTLVWALLVQQPAAPAPTPVQFVLHTAALKKHATLVDNELTITAGVREPYLSSATIMDFEIVGEIRLQADADGALLLYAWEPEIFAATAFPIRLDASPRFGELSGEGVHATHDSTVAAAFLAAARDWQWIRVSCIGRHVRVTCRPAFLTEGDLPLPDYGRIGLEVTRGSISLRNWQFVRGQGLAARPLQQDNADALDAEAKTPGLTIPTLVREVKPQYTSNAMRGKVRGNTELEAIVERDGFVGPIRVTKSLDRELDIQAIRALRQWHFTPALMNGQPVRCRVTIVTAFTLK